MEIQVTYQGFDFIVDCTPGTGNDLTGEATEINKITPVDDDGLTWQHIWIIKLIDDPDFLEAVDKALDYDKEMKGK